MLRAESHRDHRSTSYLGTSPTSSSSSLSTKEQRSKQLQILQQQQQRLSKQYRQQQQHSQAYSLNVSGRVSPLSFTLPTAGQTDTRRKDMGHTGAKENRKLENEGYPSQDRRQSHMSDRHMRLLSDETPPDDLDGSWGLDNLDDDYSLSRASQIQELQDHHTFNDNTPFNEQNDSNIAKNNDTPTPPQQYHNDRKSTCTNGEKLASLDMSLRSNSSSTYIRKSSLPHDNTNIDHNNDKFPWRDSKLDNIFTELVEDGTQQRSPQQPTPGQDDQDRSGASSSLSFGDIMDALNNGEESYDVHTRTTKQAKLEQAKQRLVELMPNGQVSPISKESVSLGSTPRSSYRLKSVMNTPGSHHSSGSRPPLSSYSSYRRSMGSRDSEFGDRGSTTSRDSLSGSTLGSIGFQAQMDGLKKAELANVLLALKSGLMDPLMSNTRILPNNLSKATPSLVELRDHEELPVNADDTDATPRPRRAILPHLSTRDRASPTHVGGRDSESDPRARQYARLAGNGLSKQSSSFVEELANATDTALRLTDTSVKLPSPSHKERQSGPPLPEELEFELSDEELTRKPREVTFGKATNGGGRVQEENDMDDLGSLAGSRAMENAFKSLESLDMSFDIKSEKGYASEKSASTRRRSSQADGIDNYLSSVQLPSKPKRKGEHSLKWEDQIDTVSESSRGWKGGLSRSSSKSTIHNSSSMMPEESSFSHAEGHLIRFITGLHPWEEWDQVKSLDLSKREVESLIKLNHLVPNLEVLLVNENQVSYLTGIPKSVKTLQARANQLSNLTSFSHLMNLQYLDISHNGIEDLTGLSSLVHLRELNVANNKVKGVSALQQMDGLIRLDVSHNCLTSLDFRWSRLQRLEFLNASHNKIEQLENLESLAGLIHANLAHNSIEDISLVKPLLRLRILRLSENKLLNFNALSFPGLRTLYLDDNRLQSLENCQTLTRLENFSARDQEGEGIAIDMTDFINSRKLYLSGNPIHSLDFNMGFYRMEYLEICAGCLSELPIDFATLMPNLRGLNLSYNSLDSISALDGLHRLRRLIFVGNTLKSFSDVLSLVKRMRSLVTLDLRHNPLTSNMYPAMSVKQGSKYQDTYRTNQNSETELDWRRRDIGFRRALPDAMYIKRSVYRSAILKSCKRLEWFDGGVIQTKERERVPTVLGDLMDNYGRNYLSRREDDEDEWDYEPYDEEEYYQGYDPRLQHELVYTREEMADFVQDDDVEEQDDYYDDRDPEDITDNSKRQTASSVDNESIIQRERLRQQQILIARQAAPKSPSARAGSSQARRLTSSQSGVHMSSPSPRVGTMSRSNTGTTVQSQPSYGAHEEDQQPAEGSDKRSAVKSWRDDVNEASMRKLQSPRAASTIPGTPRHSQMLLRENKASSVHSGSSGRSRTSARNETTNTAQETGMMSTTAVANNSGERYRSSATPVEAAPLRALSFQQRGRHARGRSDGGEAMMTPSTPRRPNRRPQSLHRMSSSFAQGEPTILAAQSPMHRSMTQIRQLSMSPMGVSTEQIGRPTHLRRRSLGMYHQPSSSSLLANGRRRELTGDLVSPDGISGEVGSPGYFGMSHHTQQTGLVQSPYGFGKSFGNGRSLPNTPSKSGRVSRVSQGYSSQTLGTLQCHTLARDMELSTTQD
ncbi:hypothetical protein BGZ52_004096 [Haplosporangium bisporale]|nr:hypothetical protein BGZ52_004096 [Haplosporangium bisporale]